MNVPRQTFTHRHLAISEIVRNITSNDIASSRYQQRYYQRFAQELVQEGDECSELSDQIGTSDLECSKGVLHSVWTFGSLGSGTVRLLAGFGGTLSLHSFHLPFALTV